MRMIVDDDGQGFDTHAALEFSQHIKVIGLFSIREWVTTMEGTFSAESEKDKGTRVLITIPVSEMRETDND
ncbi:hypothetical protein QUF75_19505 [Desulfococcaceae bacterium HSG7]|nr:hypothetical protein [Desulfococcaceae bacterium HSG7]